MWSKWADVSTDIENEDLRAQIKTLQYEVESFKQERELATLRHDKELRDTQLRAEEMFRKAQVRINHGLIDLQAADKRRSRRKKAADMSPVTSTTFSDAS